MTPGQLRFAFALWTRAMLRELIGREFGVRLSEVSVGRLLRKLGLSPQRPLYRACQQNPLGCLPTPPVAAPGESALRRS
jgi:transposase